MDTKYTIAEAAKITKVSQRTLLRAIKNGNLKTEKAGRRHLISERTLNSYLGGSNISLNDALLTFLKNKKSEMVATLQKIVSMPSISSEIGQEEKLANYIKKRLDEWGIRCVVYKEGTSIAVRATYGFANEGFLLDSPLDTLPAGDSVKWTHPPFDGEVVNGKMYGRGTADAKAGIVTQLYSLLFFKRNIDEDKVRIELVFYTLRQD
ncbi:MAG: ArgE/DapE family peptidase [Candidatus Woesebacteria bacterium GW2011_GWA1_37_8]|uniref:ArgE/DapE family peptidase n=1 Tax=Candidatus Woesebacteria bacterium GW2011_GWA1_37_8 TaxID=1618546 RepID=A0A0G0HZE6_9BACT|nr:MAG: ArgE/DapE family peptidase [Candidatus Woesebacteria bacterium GW2011_GWA1_37_8]